ncbi:MAG: sulfatase, partial [Deltaproteobacteria bacterium]|nr:sulfatase [Deltaproteobacteria bacterium]
MDDDNHAYRDGILAVAPTDARFMLRVPPRARLSFSAGLFKASRPGDTATFRVVIETKGEATTVFAREIAARPDDWHWHDAVVDLEAWAGQDIRLLLETRAPSQSRGLAVWGTPLVTSSRRAGDPPNVVVIAVDTLRADRLSAYGYGRRTSPQIEALAAQGTLFHNAFSASNWTSPAFASIFTGFMPSKHQVIHRARAIPSEMTTLAEYFRRAGWTTHAIVYKAYLYNMGFEQGFDTWFNVPRYDVRADDNLAKAMAWLDQYGHSRFFLFLHFNDPHQPFNQPPPFDRVYNTADDLARQGVSLPIVIEPGGGVRGCGACTAGGVPKPGFEKLAHALYDGAVAYVDDRIGKFLSALKERALYDKT